MLFKRGQVPLLKSGYLKNQDNIDFYGNILATENQQTRINDVIEVKNGVYLLET